VHVIDVAEIVAAVAEFDPAGHQRAAESRDRTLTLLRTHPRPLDRTSYDPGHVTASGIVLSRDGTALLLVLHRRLGRWLQPGGHLDPRDDTAMGAARREVIEETGITPDPAVPPLLVGIDVHRIPAARGEPAHLHHDLVYRFSGPLQAPRPSAEVSRAVWRGIGDLEAAGADEPLRRAVARARLAPPTPHR
jgi:8-oxo-dGTP pyrophosphatase MutT (NUDIX family)